MAKDNFCIYCGFKLFPEDHFCPNCGKKLDEADVPQHQIIPLKIIHIIKNKLKN